MDTYKNGFKPEDEETECDECGNKKTIKHKQVGPNSNFKLDIGFKVFKLDTSNIKPWDGSIESFGQLQLDSVDNIKSDRTTEDVLFEILLKMGLDLTVPIETIACKESTLYNIGMGALLVCLDTANDSVIDKIVAIKKDLELDEIKVVFQDNSFVDDVAKTNYSQQLESAGIKNIQVV